MTDVKHSGDGYDFINMTVEITQHFTSQRSACYYLGLSLGPFAFFFLFLWKIASMLEST